MEILGRFIIGKSHLLIFFHKHPLLITMTYQCTLDVCSLMRTVAVLIKALSDALLIVTVLVKNIGAYSSPFCKTGLRLYLDKSVLYLVVNAIFVLSENSSHSYHYFCFPKSMPSFFNLNKVKP